MRIAIPSMLRHHRLVCDSCGTTVRDGCEPVSLGVCETCYERRLDAALRAVGRAQA